MEIISEKVKKFIGNKEILKGINIGTLLIIKENITSQVA